MAYVATSRCKQIQSGNVSQLDAGMAQIMDCDSEGFNMAIIGNVMPIPYSPPNNVDHPISEMSTPPEVASMVDKGTGFNRPNMPYYQDYVMCPNGETNPFLIGLTTWLYGKEAIEDKFQVLSDLGIGELVGFLLPAVGLSYVGYKFLKGKKG